MILKRELTKIHNKISSLKNNKKIVFEATEKNKYFIIFSYSILIMIASLFFNSPLEILSGMKKILTAQSLLLSDYMSITNPGTAIFNSGLLMMIAVVISKFNNVNMNGTIIAAIFTVAGFALFGKNIYNSWSIIVGVFIYSKIQNEPFRKFLLIALFGTALGPMISYISFGINLDPLIAIIFANIIGLLAGVILPSLAHHFILFHQGFNLYNIGFTAGMVGTIFMSLFRAFGIETPEISIVIDGYNKELNIYLILLFSSMLLIGYLFNDKSFKGYSKLLKHTGRLVDDFVVTEGFGISLINMGLLGLFSTIYIFLIKGNLNGPVIGGIFTVVAFGAFGKHLKNVFPIFIGVILGAYFQIWEINSVGAILAVLFGTTLAPIAGVFGWKSGVAAGFLHMALVMNIGYLHGGMNLYNNGFSGGMVAAMLVPIISA
ncbi:uncharacterized protein DUF1576 [Halanaerobium saccharolyticum]|uniref:Uncharacterized protein DUF1576 n=1 Tax=Halanaerobium saccharolyticum TaxID=43595 RepID=A0A4R6LBU5_9FIRM|nr:DUF1576 domain-containing protein [Halanaerobium saccharolyticum]TDO73384.1 uncharacterized protein DUF1576 [Halanaerobium saccharolyticum]